MDVDAIVAAIGFGCLILLIINLIWESDTTHNVTCFTPQGDAIKFDGVYVSRQDGDWILTNPVTKNRVVTDMACAMNYSP